MRALVLLALLPLACFDARVRPCTVSCTAADPGCPGGLVCDTSRNLCEDSPGACGSLPDAGDVDAGDRDAARADGPPGDAPPPGECVADTLCAERTDFGTAGELPAGWDLHLEGGCTGVVEDDTIHFAAQPAGCGFGNACWVRTRTLPLGTARVTARPSSLTVQPGGVVTMRVIGTPSDWMGFRFGEDDEVSAVSVRGGTDRVLATEPFEDDATYAVRATDDDRAVFEVFRVGATGWVELARGPAGVHEDETAALELVFACGTGTDEFFEAYFGEVGDQEP